MNVLSLCAGIGGFDLGIKRAIPEARTVCYVEIDSFCQGVLARRMDDGWLDHAPIWPDLRTFDGQPWRGVVDCVAAGFPCQPFSQAGQRRGDADARNLWPDVRRVIGESKPAVVLLENVPGALPYFYHVVLPELQGLGYAAQTGLFTAAEVGTPHRRERVFVVAHAVSIRRNRTKAWSAVSDTQRHMAAPQGRRNPILCAVFAGGQSSWPAGPGRVSEIPRMDDGLPHGMDQLRALGNAVVPAQAQWAIRLLMEGMNA